MSVMAIPEGGGVMDGVRLFTEPGRLGSVQQRATQWVDEQLAMLRAAPSPNPYRGMGDEELCEEILRRVSELSSQRARVTDPFGRA